MDVNQQRVVFNNKTSLVVRIQRTPEIDAMLKQYGTINNSNFPKIKLNGAFPISIVDTGFGISLSSDQEVLDYDEDMQSVTNNPIVFKKNNFGQNIKLVAMQSEEFDLDFTKRVVFQSTPNHTTTNTSCSSSDLSSQISNPTKVENIPVVKPKIIQPKIKKLPIIKKVCAKPCESLVENCTKIEPLRSCKFDTTGSIIIVTRNVQNESPNTPVQTKFTTKNIKPFKSNRRRKKWTESIKNLSVIEKWHSINSIFESHDVLTTVMHDDKFNIEENSVLNESQSTIILDPDSHNDNYIKKKTTINDSNKNIVTTEKQVDNCFKLPLGQPPKLKMSKSSRSNSVDLELLDKLDTKSDIISLHPRTIFDDNASLTEDETDDKPEVQDDSHTYNTNSSQFNIFLYICYDYYCKNQCLKENCPQFHYMNVAVQEKLRDLPFSVLLETVRFVLKTTKLFTEILPYLIRNLQKFQPNFEIDRELIKLVESALESSLPSKLYVKNVLNTLQNLGKSLKDSIDSIIMCYGAGRTEICNVLLDIITDEKNICDLWDNIKNILMWRKEKLENSTVRKLLKYCLSMNLTNFAFCKNVKEFIIDKNLIDVNNFQLEVKKLLNILQNNNNNTESIAQKNSNINEFYYCTADDSSSSDVESDESNYENNVDVREKCNSEEDKQDIIKCNTIDDNHNSYIPAPVLSNLYSEYSPANKKSKQDYLKNYNNDNSFINISTHKSSSKDKYSPSKMSIISPYNPTKPEISNYKGPVFETFEPLSVFNIMYPRNFGTLILHPKYVFNSSLHNNYPVSEITYEVTPEDVSNLKICINNMDGRVFLLYIKKYKFPPSAESFVANCVVHFIQPPNMFDVFNGLIESLENCDVNFMRDSSIKAIMEVIAFNFIVHLEKRGQWHFISKILLRFSDWDSLITSKLFLQFLGKRNFTLMGRYIYICKLFIRANNFHWPNEIFQSDKLSLLKRCDNWPYFYKHCDVQFRNNVLYQFFHLGFLNNIISINDLYKYVRRLNGIENFDTWFHFNNMMLFLLNNYEQHFNVLKQLFRDIVNIYHPYIDTRMMRALMVFMFEELRSEEVFSFYSICCKCDIYPDFVGNEDNIYIKNGTLDNEIVIMLKYYFLAMFTKKLLPPQQLTIHIILEKLNPCPLLKILEYSRSVSQIRISLLDILRKYFYVTKCNGRPSVVIIDQVDLMNYYNSLEAR